MAPEAALSSGSSPNLSDKTIAVKRAAIDGEAPPHKVTKRRAARACVSCRARKVRCDVVEGAPCGNCRWDNVECIVQESRRRKKNLVTANAAGSGSPDARAQQQQQQRHQQQHQQHQHQQHQHQQHQHQHHQQHTQQRLRCRAASSAAAPNPSAACRPPADLALGPGPGPGTGAGPGGGIHDMTDDFAFAFGHATRAPGLSPPTTTLGGDGSGHVPHMIYQRTVGYRPDAANLLPRALPADHGHADQGHADLFASARTAQFLSSLELPDVGTQLPGFIRPLPAKIAVEDVRYLYAKGALSLPSVALQNALLQAYVEYVHPYMPLMDLHDFLAVVARRDGLDGQTSLFLYQAVMFSATAFVDGRLLREAGYASRKAARKAFFQKTRLLYDFDYESDRLVLVQGLMLMTYWYETPDDQKDTWHWMGVAISLAHTIGLHRNPETTSMSVAKQRLWKRIWWSCFMRDRLIALGMRRPTRIKDEDFDVPMLVESDFEVRALPEAVSAGCRLLRDVAMQRELAVLCIAKARLCICISHMLMAQYSVLIRDKMKPENTTNSTMMLFPNKQPDNVEGLDAVNVELAAWAESLPACCRYRPPTALDVDEGRSTVAVQRTLLHMVYQTTVSALHRPQFLPSSPLQAPVTSRQAQDLSRLRVRDAAAQMTAMATQLHQLRLERFLPTTGVTVILPAMIIHLLEMKNPVPQERERAMRGFRQCMRVMERLRDMYAAADYASGFLDAALRKAAIDVNGPQAMAKPAAYSVQTPPPDNMPYMTASETLFMGDEEAAAAAATPRTVTVTAAALELSASSPPQTDLESPAGLTPSASGGSDLVADNQAMDVDFMQGHDEFDWNAVAGTDFDVDQWLQFPPEPAGDEADAESKAMAQVLDLDQLAGGDGDQAMAGIEVAAGA